MRSKVLTLGLAALAVGGSAAAKPLTIYPVRGLYGLENSACGRPGGADAASDTALIAPALCPVLDQDARIAIGQHFQDRVRALFSNTVTDLLSQAGEGESAEARLSKTIIASLTLTRADLWTVEKPAANDAYVPISLSLFLTNALTGEVLFVDNQSIVVQGTLGKSNYLSDVRSQFPAQLRQAVDSLVADAAARFKPYAVTGQVRSKIDGRYLFSVGRRGGLADGDLLGAQAKVAFSDTNYSVVDPLLGDLSVGATLTRDVAQPIEILAKPSALVVVARTPDGTSRGYLNGLFEDAVGANAGLAIAPVNSSFVQLRRKVIAEAQLGSEFNSKRRLPDYFIRLSVIMFDPYEVSTNLAGVRRRTYGARAFVEVLDHSGRVVFATQASNQISDEVALNISFSPDQRRDTVVKNAVSEAAKALARDFRPAMLRLPIRPAADEVDIADAGGALNIGATAVALRKSSGISGIQGEIWTPVANVEVRTLGKGSALARITDPVPKPVRLGDQVAYESGAAGLQSARLFGECVSEDGRPRVDRRGSVDQPMFEAIAVNSFAGSFRAPVQLIGFASELKEYLSQFEGVVELSALKPRKPDICFEPVYQVDPTGAQSSTRGQVSDSYSVVVGYTLRQAGVKIAGSGLQEVLKATGVPSDADPVVRNASLQTDLAVTTAKLSAQAARGIAPPS